MNSVRHGCTLRASSSAAAPQHATGRALLIASYFVLLLLAATISVQARAATTGSDKFIPTFLIYSGGPALVAADAPRLAKFDLIDIDRFRYPDIGANTWAAIKATNPAVQIYLYEMGSESPSHLDSTAQLNLNGLGRHNVSRGHFMGSLNGDRPDLFLLDSTGSRVYNVGSSNPAANQYWYLMDFGATAYQSYWVAAVKADIVDQPWAADGVFANGCLTLASDVGYSAMPALYPTNAAWTDAMNNFASSITAGLFGYGQKLWCNRGGTRSVDGAAAWLALDQTASPPDAVMEEAAFASSWGSRVVQFLPESEWKRQVDTVRAISNSKVAVVSHTKLLEDQSGMDNYGRTVSYWQALWYSLGSFLLAKNDVLGNAYFMFRGGSGYDKIWWHDEYDHIDLGKAVGPYAARKIGSVNVYWREFERGYVFVNPTPTNVAHVTLPQESRLLTRANMSAAPDSIASVSAIALNSHRAAILLKVEGAPPLDTTAPTVPGGLAASAVSPSQVDLSWSPSTDNVGVTGYMVYLNNVVLTTTTTTSFSHTGLTPGATYSYRVSAFDAAPNHSALSAAVAVTTPVPPDTTPPSTPIGLTASALTATSFTLSWAAATDNVGVVSSRVYRDGTLIIPADTTRNVAINGLSPGTTYSFTVAAVDAAGNASPQSAPLTVTPPPPDTTPPSTPTGLTASAVTSTSLTLSWDAATDNVGVVSSRVYRNGTLIVPADTTRNVAINGLSPGTTYSFTVAAVDAAGNASPQSAPLPVTTPALPDTTPPSTPTGLTASAITPTSLTLTWDPATDNAGVTGYRVHNGTLVASPTGVSVTLSGLSPSTQYAFSVAAVDAAGNASPQSAPLTVTTQAPPDTTAPTTPTGLTASAITPTALTLSWAPAADSVGVTGYGVYRDGALVASPTGTSASINGLSASTPYAFTVAAVDAAGNASPQSAPLPVTTLALPDTTPPSTPTGLTASAITPTSLTLSWDAATDNAGVAGYRVHNGTLVASPTGVSVTLTGLSPSTQYAFTVAAVDAAGNASPQSAPLTVTTQAPPDTTAPTTPTGLTATAITPTALTLSWAAAVDSVGVTGYRAYRDGALVASPTGTSASINGLSASSPYAFTVAAMDAAGNASPQSAPLTVTTLALPDTTPPSTPSGLTASAVTSTSFTLSWGAATDNAGVTGYRVYNGTLVASPTATSVALTGLSPSTQYVFTVAAVDAAGNASPQSAALTVTTQASPDTTAPSTPTGLTASAVASTSFTLSWDAATDNVGVVSSRVYRNGTLIIPADTTRNVAINGLSPNTTYSFTVAAVDAAGNVSPQSAPLSVTTLASAGTACANPAGGYQGFGRNTTGGAGLTVYRVTNLNDSGAGSLRDAVSQGNRCVVFDVGGTISLSSALLVRGANITIDGFTAPSPGISLTNWGFDWHYLRGVANIIARGIRIRGTVSPEALGADGFQIVGVNNFVIDHVSIDQWGDGSIDVAGEAGVPSQNGTIQWSFFGKGRDVEDKSLLVKYGSRRISLHHNLFLNSHDRSPYCAWFDDPALTPPANEIVCDFRNNLVLGYDWTGTSIRHRATANVVNNYFFSAIAPGAGAALYIAEGGIAYASGNFSPNGANINAVGNRATPYPADVPTTTDAITAGQQIVTQGGARGPNFGLDAADLNYIGQVSLP